MELSVVMPCLNEAKTLPACIRKAQTFLRESGVDGEVIVADNGSTDGSPEIARELGARVVPVPAKGYGAALSEGIYEALGTFVIMGDSDDSYDFSALQPFVDKLREGFDLVMGNRFLGGISEGAMPFMHRYVGNPMLSALGRRIYGNVVCQDFYCGLRGFRKDTITRLNIQSTGMEFALEMIIKAELYELKITEVATTLSRDGRGRKPHLRTYRDGWRSLRLYLLMSPRWTFGIPGIILSTLGLATLAASVLGFTPAAWIGAAHIFSSVATVLGYQAILLAIFAKFIAIESSLHPPATVFSMLQNRGTLERFVILGFLIASGCAFIGIAAAVWFGAPHAGALPAQIQTFLEIGLIVAGQTVMAGFYFGLLQLLRERRLYPRKRRGD
ncbi:MAG: glycosyltransferase family 2 protein [Terrimicrobiaceae bacterium]